VARHDPIVGLIRAVQGCRIADAEVDLLVSLFGFAPGSIDHLWSDIDSSDRMAELGESEGQEAGAASDVQHALGR
jgi:hypothetical protein